MRLKFSIPFGVLKKCHVQCSLVNNNVQRSRKCIVQYAKETGYFSYSDLTVWLIIFFLSANIVSAELPHRKGVCFSHCESVRFKGIVNLLYACMYWYAGCCCLSTVHVCLPFLLEFGISSVCQTAFRLWSILVCYVELHSDYDQCLFSGDHIVKQWAVSLDNSEERGPAGLQRR
jgi:hypothetical protein